MIVAHVLLGMILTLLVSGTNAGSVSVAHRGHFMKYEMYFACFFFANQR